MLENGMRWLALRSQVCHQSSVPALTEPSFTNWLKQPPCACDRLALQVITGNYRPSVVGLRNDLHHAA